jgi:hypothetical protein
VAEAHASQPSPASELAIPCKVLATHTSASSSLLLLLPVFAVISFGFSVGDFVAVGKLISDIVISLRSIGGASSEYQELTRGLNSLIKTLCYLLRLELKEDSSESTEDTTYEWYKDRIAGRVEGTCVWFLNHSYFQEWKRKEGRCLY